MHSNFNVLPGKHGIEGSCRSVESFDLFQALQNCSEVLSSVAVESRDPRKKTEDQEEDFLLEGGVLLKCRV